MNELLLIAPSNYCIIKIWVWLSHVDIALGLDVVNSRQEHLAKRVALVNETFFEAEETFSISAAIQKTRYTSEAFVVPI